VAAAANAENSVQEGLSGQLVGREVGNIAIETKGVVRAGACKKIVSRSNLSESWGKLGRNEERKQW
jgi:hypothetical protein